jgi:hypothetical protein
VAREAIEAEKPFPASFLTSSAFKQQESPTLGHRSGNGHFVDYDPVAMEPFAVRRTGRGQRGYVAGSGIVGPDCVALDLARTNPT